MKAQSRVKQARASNIEMLRIISMIFVLIVHFDGAVLGLPEPRGDFGHLTAYNIWGLAVESVAIIGVNCFTLISGYFGIRLTWRNAGAYLFECVFYAVSIATLLHFVNPKIVSWSMWCESWLVLTHTDLWYVPAYFGLMLLAPVISAGCSQLSTSRLLVLTSAFLLFNVWCGWYNKGSFNPTGYTLVQLVLMYLVGVSLQRVQIFKGRSLFFTGLWLASTTSVFISALYLDYRMAFAYNSPLVIASSVTMFCIFAGINFKSRSINYVAKSAFAVYLIHKQPQVWGGVLKPWLHAFSMNTGILGYTGVMLATCGAVFAVAMLADSIRRWLWHKIEKSAIKVDL